MNHYCNCWICLVRHLCTTPSGHQENSLPLKGLTLLARVCENEEHSILLTEHVKVTLNQRNHALTSCCTLHHGSDHCPWYYCLQTVRGVVNFGQLSVLLSSFDRKRYTAVDKQDTVPIYVFVFCPLIFSLRCF